MTRVQIPPPLPKNNRNENRENVMKADWRKWVDTVMVLILFLVFIFTLWICSQVEWVERQIPEYTVVIVDGCEYLKVKTSHGHRTLTHKGNCNNH